MGKKYIIAGAGFRGFCDAMELSKIPGAEVTIVESAPFFGGLMHSLEIGGFFVDKGVHVFDSIPMDLADIVNEIMDGQTHKIE
ncbi:MAG: NAD(P)-binding protein, partial [Gammaproteobacteria bacterium]|nr:NAD(P)-binding protein [Gammaproteobacteria bacterium]